MKPTIEFDIPLSSPYQMGTAMIPPVLVRHFAKVGHSVTLNHRELPNEKEPLPKDNQR